MSESQECCVIVALRMRMPKSNNADGVFDALRDHNLVQSRDQIIELGPDVYCVVYSTSAGVEACLAFHRDRSARWDLGSGHTDVDRRCQPFSCFRLHAVHLTNIPPSLNAERLRAVLQLKDDIDLDLDPAANLIFARTLRSTGEALVIFSDATHAAAGDVQRAARLAVGSDTVCASQASLHVIRRFQCAAPASFRDDDWASLVDVAGSEIRDVPELSVAVSGEVADTLAILASALGDPLKQKGLLERSLAIKEKHYGVDHFEVAKTLVCLGVVHGALGDPLKQKQLLDRALVIQERHYGVNGAEVADTLAILADAHAALGHPLKQKELLERSLVVKERHLGVDHYQVAMVLVNLAHAHYVLRDAHKTKELLERALVIQEKHHGAGVDHHEVASTLVSLANTYGVLGDARKQMELLERALVIQEKHYGVDHSEVAKTLVCLGAVHGALGDPLKQKQLLDRALVIQERRAHRHHGVDGVEVADTLAILADAHAALGDPLRQKEQVERARVIQEKH